MCGPHLPSISLPQSWVGPPLQGNVEGWDTLCDGPADVVLLLEVVWAMTLGWDGAAHETWR